MYEKIEKKEERPRRRFVCFINCGLVKSALSLALVRPIHYWFILNKRVIIFAT